MRQFSCADKKNFRFTFAHLRQLKEFNPERFKDFYISVALVTDPRIDYEAPRVLPASAGPNSFTAKKFEAPDLTSTSPTITVQCPSYNTGIGQVVFYHMKAKLAITGTDLERLLIGVNRIALRAFHIHTAASSMTLSINDVSTSFPAPFTISSALLSQGFSSHSMAL